MARKKYLDSEPDHHHDPNAENIGKNHKLQNNQQRNVLGPFGHHHNKPLGHGHGGLALGMGHPGHGQGNRGNQGGLGGGTKCKNSGAPECPISAAVEDNYSSVMKQLQLIGLTIREMPGDGNCLFRALADQLEGHTRNHLDHRRAVVQYMKDNRPNFEPFVEDDEPFEKYVQTLSQPGTFAGNDAIVAFARLHNVTVVIHQLNSPAWLIHPTTESEGSAPSGREVHIAYHNGDHYNSVRKIGDDSDGPSNIKFVSHSQGCLKQKSGKVSPPRSSSRLTNQNQPQIPHPPPSVNHFERDEDYWVKDDADIERLVDEVQAQTNYPDRITVRDTLIDNNFDMVSTVDYMIRISYLINQTVQPGKEKGADETSGSGIPEVVSKNTIEDKGSEFIPNDENAENVSLTNLTPVSLLDSGTENSAADVVNMNEVFLTGTGSSQLGNSIPAGNATKAKLNGRQKKALKKRERKLKSDKRKDNENENTSSENSSPTLGSLNI